MTAPTHALTRAVRAALKAAADPTQAPQMQAYMKSAMPYRGVSSPAQKRIYRRLFSATLLESRALWRRVTLELWRQARYREERYAAIALCDWRAYAKYHTMAAIPMLEEMVVTGAWWDYVDALATHPIGDVVRACPGRAKPLLRRWARGDDMWKRRAAILSQMRFKEDTDLDLLYACIAPSLGDPRFFLRKAIGWALRQYAWVDGREVRRYVNEHAATLSALSAREALRNLG